MPHPIVQADFAPTASKKLVDPGTGSRVHHRAVNEPSDTKSKRERALHVGAIAKLAGVSVDTVRHYERVGVLPKSARTLAGYRNFPPETSQRVLLVRSAIQAGFSLKELARVLRVRDSGGAPCREVQSLAKSKLVQVREQIAALQVLEKLLHSRVTAWNRKLARTPQGVPARLLDDLAKVLSNLKSKRGNK